MKNKRSIKDIWFSINLVDRFLIFIMMLFLAYSIMTIYIRQPELTFIANIDIIVRTSIASIFGYFISSNFIKTESTKNKTETEISNVISDDSKIIEQQTSDSLTTKSKIGFNVGDDTITKSTESDIGAVDIKDQPKIIPASNSIETQTLVVGIICIIAIIALLLTRFSLNTTSNDVATLSQLRDIICGSVGFLIGIPASDSTENN